MAVAEEKERRAAPRAERRVMVFMIVLMVVVVRLAVQGREGRKGRRGVRTRRIPIHSKGSGVKARLGRTQTTPAAPNHGPCPHS